MATIPDSHKAILTQKSFAHVATVSAEGIPQVTPVWIDYDGEFVLVNSAKGRKKDRNLRATRRVAISVLDPADPYRYLALQGEVMEITEEGAEAHINQLSHRYRGQDYDYNPNETRVIYKIKPTAVSTHN